jgi:hypothetical protein
MFRMFSRHFAWWEGSPEVPDAPKRALKLPSREFTAAVAAAREELADIWAEHGKDQVERPDDNEHPAVPWVKYRLVSGRRVELHDAGIWKDQGRSVRQRGKAARRPGEFRRRRIRLRGQGWRPSPSRRLGRGCTVGCREANAVGTLHLGHADGPCYLRFGRPGQSELRIKSVVPEGAVGLRILIRHGRALRAILRRAGYATFRLRVEGLPIDFTSTAPTQGIETGDVFPRDLTDSHTRVEVPVHLLVGRSEIEVVLEYLHGNTTYRIMGVELDWDVPGRSRKR